MPKLKIKGKTKKFKYTKEGIASYKKQLAKSKKMPKSVGNDSKESQLNTGMNLEKFDAKNPRESFNKDSKGHYEPRMRKGFKGEIGGIKPQKNQINEAQEKERAKIKKKKRKRLTPSKPQQGY